MICGGFPRKIKQMLIKRAGIGLFSLCSSREIKTVAREEMTEKLSDTVVIRGINGKEIGRIKTYQSYSDYLKTTEFGGSGGFLTVSHKHPVWKNQKDIAIWAWQQSLTSGPDIKYNTMPSTCIVCNKKSINKKRSILFKNRWIGVYCSNKECPMFNVLIPAEMFFADPGDISISLDRLD